MLIGIFGKNVKFLIYNWITTKNKITFILLKTFWFFLIIVDLLKVPTRSKFLPVTIPEVKH